MSKTIDENAAPSPAIAIEDRFYPTKTDENAAPSPASSGTPAKAGAVQTEAAPEPAEDEKEPESEGKSKSPRMSFRELRTARDRAEARSELLEKQLADAKTQTKPAASLPATVPAVANDPAEPKSENYTDFDVFMRDRERWNRAQWENEKAAEVQRAEEAKSVKEAEAQSAKHLGNWNTREAVLVAKHASYPEAFDSFLNVARGNRELATEVFESPAGPDIALYLGGNAEELARFQALSGRQLAKAIGVLEDKLTEKPPVQGSEKTITKAPRPLSSVTAPTGGVKKELSIEERFYGKN